MFRFTIIMAVVFVIIAIISVSAPVLGRQIDMTPAFISASGNSIGDCNSITVKKATNLFHHEDGSRSRFEWTRVTPGHLEHRGAKVYGQVPDNHFVHPESDSSMWSLEGKTVAMNNFSVWCVPDSGTYNTDEPPLTCPAIVDDAVFIYGGDPDFWSGGALEGSRTLRYNGGTEKLGAFTVPFQAFVLARKPSSGAWYYTPGDSVRPSAELEITCW